MTRPDLIYVCAGVLVSTALIYPEICGAESTKNGDAAFAVKKSPSYFLGKEAHSTCTS